jgi:hypothetical protein
MEKERAMLSGEDCEKMKNLATPGERGRVSKPDVQI